MNTSDFGIKTYCFLALAVGCALVATPSAAQTYFNDFEDTLDPLTGWSIPVTDTTPSGRRFLGQFCNDTVILALPSAPTCEVTVSFDLFVILTWDGNGEYCCGPDRFTFSATGDTYTLLLLDTTFGTTGHTVVSQAYPGLLGSVNPPNAGAEETNTLGYLRGGEIPMDAVYHLSFTFPHDGGPLYLDFSAFGLQGVEDESWGLDNVMVNCPPDCSNATPSVDTLWPVNHKFVSINIMGVTDPDDDPVTITITSIFQDEPVNVEGSGSTEPDGQGIGTDTAEVRAERSGTKKVPGNGRVYHISFIAEDGAGGICEGTVTVCVPHDQSGDPCIDEGALYDSTVP